jgi:hypothetical protein
MKDEPYAHIIGSEECFCKHFSDFSEIERRYLETLVEEAIMNKGISVTKHCMQRLKQRNYSLGKLQYAVRQGKIMEVQFDKTGCKIQLSYASGSQLGKGYTCYCIYDICTGNVISAWNRQNRCEQKLNPETYVGRKKYLKKDDQIIYLVNTYLNIPPDMVQGLIFKYDKTPLVGQAKKQLNILLQGLKLHGNVL